MNIVKSIFSLMVLSYALTAAPASSGEIWDGKESWHTNGHQYGNWIVKTLATSVNTVEASICMMYQVNKFNNLVLIHTVGSSNNKQKHAYISISLMSNGGILKDTESTTINIKSYGEDIDGYTSESLSVLRDYFDTSLSYPTYTAPTSYVYVVEKILRNGSIDFSAPVLKQSQEGTEAWKFSGYGIFSAFAVLDDC